MKKVLVVDDSKTVRTLCEWIFKGLEDKILTADSATSARNIIAAESPDIVLVDYTLPDADAYEFMSSIRSMTRVIALGGTYAPFDIDKARANGAMAVLIKPFKTADFFETLDNVMAQETAHEPILSRETPASSVESVESVAPAASTSAVAPAIEPVAPTSSVVEPIAPPRSASISSSQFAKVSAASPQVAPISSISGITTTSGLHSRRFNFPGSSSPAIPVASHHGESATPKTPVPSVSPAVQSGQQIQIDPVVLRAEVIAAVKSMLPAIVSSYLKKLIQAEVKPQLQNWVDTRVEALIKRMIQM